MLNVMNNNVISRFDLIPSYSMNFINDIEMKSSTSHFLFGCVFAITVHSYFIRNLSTNMTFKFCFLHFSPFWNKILTFFGKIRNYELKWVKFLEIH